MEPTKPKASAVVMASFDIMEDIMLRLPLREVLLVQGVCKTWKNIHEKSTRIQKVLFLTPAFDQKIYYPNCSNPTWYLAPGRDELIAAGLVSEPDEGSDGDVTPTNSPKPHHAHKYKPTDETKSATYVDNALQAKNPEGKLGFKGKLKLFIPFTSAADLGIGGKEAEGKGLVKTKVDPETGKVKSLADGNQVELGKHKVSGKTNGMNFEDAKTVSKMSKAKSVADGNQGGFGKYEVSGKTNGMNSEDAKTVSKMSKAKSVADGSQAATNGTQKKVNEAMAPYTPDSAEVDSNNNINIFGRKAGSTIDAAAAERTAQYQFANSIPKLLASRDGKMMVSRVTGPFINPFFEIFFDRFFRGSRGGYYPTNGQYYPSTNIPASVDLVVHPQVQLRDGTTVGRSRKTRAVQRNDASWRKMHPFSALVSSIEVECFDFGAFEVYADFGMLAGHMMDQLGKHWGEKCPDCCIPDFWFSEFIKKICLTDGSHWNRGKHGVKKLGLNHTGWEILYMMNAGEVEVTSYQDRIRPY